jgi:hypothetical protein
MCILDADMLTSIVWVLCKKTWARPANYWVLGCYLVTDGMLLTWKDFVHAFKGATSGFDTP